MYRWTKVAIEDNLVKVLGMVSSPVKVESE